jgi:heme-degrading monooxygenase HmoA
MFIVIISFPPIKEGRDADFQKWFASSNQAFCKFSGFISRRLLKPVNGGNYAAICEFKDQTSFQAMHTSPAHEEAGRRVALLLDGHPAPLFYEVVAEK